MIGLAGVLSLLLAPFERLASGQDLSFTIRVVMLVQPAVLIIAAVATGQALAGKLGLGTPLIDAWLKGTGFGPVLRRQAPAALLTGLIVGLLMIAYSSVILPAFTDTATMEKMAAFEVPLVTRLLYGGITEELLTRWGLMTLFAWVLWRIVGKGQGASPTGHAVECNCYHSGPFCRGPPALSVCHSRSSATIADCQCHARQFYPRTDVRVAVLASRAGSSDAFPRFRPLRECNCLLIRRADR